jgi:hypothetical protein
VLLDLDQRWSRRSSIAEFIVSVGLALIVPATVAERDQRRRGGPAETMDES